MAKRGDLARENVKNTIIDAFNKDGNFVAFQDKKIYVQARDGENGEMIQFAITMTMPKVAVAASSSSDTSNDTGVANVVEFTAADRQKVEELKKRLGVIS